MLKALITIADAKTSGNTLTRSSWLKYVISRRSRDWSSSHFEFIFVLSIPGFEISESRTMMLVSTIL